VSSGEEDGGPGQVDGGEEVLRAALAQFQEIADDLAIVAIDEAAM
jgi:hypothetical protein